MFTQEYIDQKFKEAFQVWSEAHRADLDEKTMNELHAICDFWKRQKSIDDVLQDKITAVRLDYQKALIEYNRGHY